MIRADATRFHSLPSLVILTLWLAPQCYVGHAQLTSAQCQQIRANATCQCHHTELGGIRILCEDNEPKTSVEIYVSADRALEITCRGSALHTSTIVDKLPPLFVGDTIYSYVDGCLPFGNILAHLGARPQEQFEMRGMPQNASLTRQHFSLLQNVSSLRIFQFTHFDADVFADLSGLRSLNLDARHVRIPSTIFQPLVGLRELVLNANFTQLQEGIFRNLSQLQNLIIWYSPLRTLQQGDLQELPMLAVIAINFNQVELVPADLFAQHSQLVRISLAGNKLRALPPTLLSGQHRLEYLDLNKNRLESLPVGLFADNGALQELVLSSNQLRHIVVDTFAPLHSLQRLDLGYNRLYTIEPGTFASLGQLRELDLSGNSLHTLAASGCSVFSGLTALTSLNLRNNQLVGMCSEEAPIRNLTSHLLILNLAGNKLSQLSVGFLRALNASSQLRRLYLEHNPWSCDCAAGEMLHFLKARRKTVGDIDTVSCADPKLAPFVALNYYDMCLPEVGVQTGVAMLTICVVAVILLLSIVALLYYKYQLEIRIWLYARDFCLCCFTEQDLDRDKRFDAFISFSHLDEQFVRGQLLPGLENGPTNAFHMCIHLRDWPVGTYIPEQIVRSVEQSRRTIIVLSQHFIESDWALMEFRTAHQCTLDEGRVRIILVVYGEIPEPEKLAPELQAYLKTNTYLKWDDPWFWEKLYYAMPHSRRRLRRAKRTTVMSNDIELMLEPNTNTQFCGQK